MKWNRLALLTLLFFFNNVLFSQNWQQVGNQLIRASHLFVDTTTNELIAGGYYSAPNGDTLCGLSKWNDSTWELFADINGNAFFSDIVSYDGDIVVGGNINSLNHLSKWDGETWSSVGTLTADVQQYNSTYDLHVFNGQLFIGGFFYGFGDNGFGIVRYDGENWHDMQTTNLNIGSDVDVTAIQDFNGELYVGGGFVCFEDDPFPTFGISRWNGEEWKAVGSGLGFSLFGQPASVFIQYDGSLYIAGNFGSNMFSLTKSQYIVRWDGSDYHQLAETEPCCIEDMVVYKNELYALARFESSSEIGRTDFAKWDGSKWCSLETIFNGPTYDMEVYNDTLYVAGAFTKINGVPIRAVAKWTGGDFVGACSEPLSSEESILTQDGQGEIQVSPNPFQGSTNVFVPNSISSSMLTVYHATGQTIHQQRLAVGMNSVGLEELVPGLYFYMVMEEGRALQTGKLVKVE